MRVPLRGAEGLKEEEFFFSLLVLVCESLFINVHQNFHPSEIYSMINWRCTQRVERVA